jgi:predicted nucleic acid-binding protein
MKVLVDTNLLIRSALPFNSLHKTAVLSVQNLRDRGDDLFIVPQCLYEFWVVATRPAANNGLGMSLQQAAAELVKLKILFHLLPETRAAYAEWEKLILQYQVIGKQAHDTRFVAVMVIHALNHILTFNFSDFKRFTNITAIDPHTVA